MWQPREDYWNYIKGLLESVTSGNTKFDNSKTDHSSISKAIEEFSKLPDSAHYYAYIFVFDEQSSDPARGLAGLLFKNKLRASVDCLGQEEVEVLIKEVISGPMIKLLATSKSSFIQRTIGTILSTLVTDCNALTLWPSLLNELLLIGSTAALSSIERICEDAAFELIEHPETFKNLIENLFILLQSTQSLKVHILNIISYLIPTQSPLLTGNVNFLLENVLKMNVSDEIKVISCRLLSTLLEFYWPLLDSNQLQRIFNFILQLTIESNNNNNDRDLLKQCLEFWLFQVQSDSAIDILPTHLNEGHLTHLIPLLMEKCSYDEEEDEDELCKAMEDLSVPDEEDDLKPRHHRPKETENETATEDENDLGEDDSIVTSIRKCSAATLDGLSLCIPSTIFLNVFLPAFNDRIIKSNDWKIREGALLAFGAVAEGLLQQLTPQLDKIAPFLLANAHSHPHPLVRSMSLWSISRISPWFIESSQQTRDECLRILIGSLGDANKRVQQSAATAICKVLESSEISLSFNDRKSLISAIFLALKCYQRRSLLILYDLIRIFGAVSFEDNLLTFDAEAFQYWRSIVTILIDRFSPESIADSSIFPIIEALMSILLLDFDGNLLDSSKRNELDFKTLSLAAQNLTALKEAQAEGFGDSIVSEGLDDFLIASLDLLAAATESSRLVPSQQLQPLLRNILSASLLFKDSSNVRQSAFALIGDYALSASPQILNDSQLESSYFQAIQQNCFPSSLTSGRDEMLISMAAATNAIWSLGEVSLSTEIPIPPEILIHLISILKDRPSLEVGARIYFENIAVCIGRILVTTNADVNNILDSSSFLNRILNLLTTVESSEERASALSGYIRIFRRNNCSARDYQLFISKINELVDFSDVIEVRLSQNLSGFARTDIQRDFYQTLQPNLANLLHNSQ